MYWGRTGQRGGRSRGGGMAHGAGRAGSTGNCRFRFLLGVMPILYLSRGTRAGRKHLPSCLAEISRRCPGGTRAAAPPARAAARVAAARLLAASREAGRWPGSAVGGFAPARGRRRLGCRRFALGAGGDSEASGAAPAAGGSGP